MNHGLFSTQNLLSLPFKVEKRREMSEFGGSESLDRLSMARINRSDKPEPFNFLSLFLFRFSLD
jgi:hypothetical protein